MSGSDAKAWAALVDAASAPYARAGRFAYHFARGKLRRDPVFRHLVVQGLIAPRARVLDIGCGQGLLASLLAAATARAKDGGWPAGWAAAPAGAQVAGIDLMPNDIARARAALGPEADLRCADMRLADFPTVDTVVLLDVLHYVGAVEQDDVLARARRALVDGGRLLMRVGDSGSGFGFAASRWVDRVVMLARGRGVRTPTGRTSAEWQARLRALGFGVSREPMRRGRFDANVLLVATLPPKAAFAVPQAGVAMPAAALA